MTARDDRRPRETNAENGGGRDDESRLFSYALPFLAALFLALGIAGTVLGGWSIVQPAIGGCADPVIGVSTPEETEQRLSDVGPVVETLEFESLSEAERRAVLEAIEDPHQEGTVEGSFDHRKAFNRGVVISGGEVGEARYATLRSESRCLGVDPVALPLGLISLLVGVGAFTLVGVENYPWEFRWSPARERLREGGRSRDGEDGDDGEGRKDSEDREDDKDDRGRNDSEVSRDADERRWDRRER
ncbi:hypothetical protein [Natronosalvus rutilus]|uniref:Uncharacterized protein n=1 Tax=Natronosalvus rutilus TaxID=2953753 RepID=A0A9E7N8L1_9EURY|nr:hypothetical protein [Natronosalvus rutilus]UTF52388.1 hypothetical protein NGM29_11360 [Natronosalvus rutilus]